VTGRRLCRARAAVQRLDPHPPHQRSHMPAADRDPFAAQQAAQHPAAGKRGVEMQFVDPAHNGELVRGDSARLRIDAAAAEPQRRRLP